MKKVLLICFLVGGMITASSAQELGLRFGDVTGGNVALDAIFSTGKFNRIHADVSAGHGGLGVDALWDFVYLPFEEFGEPGFYWYAGAGPGLYINDPIWISAMAEIGLEYRIADVPLSVSADWRPTLTLVQTTDLYFGLFGLNVRYIFDGE
ncbi:outer membrane insertion C- signal [Marinoscillum furvescens]|uniref:Outer membrane protein n=1 Tax=Marinoscillum furvescens DSM 4134 TaxID=1122208 RepID=A0A3D9L053_MARFU|nr:outer membrane insertion C- signal [Marinoscillum furvescens]RED94347.1 hypothetical protein C7460_12134 [Marinoscillum furvescens DSM 4134]